MDDEIVGIADATNTAIDLAHHSRKTGGAEVTMEDGRGAVVLLNAVRSARPSGVRRSVSVLGPSGLAWWPALPTLM